MVLPACGGSGGAAHTAVVTHPPRTPVSAHGATPATVATAAEPLADRDVDAARVYASTQRLAATIGPRAAGTSGATAARDFIAEALRSYGYDVMVEDFPFDATAYLPARVDSGGEAIPAIAFRGSGSGSVTARVVDGGLGQRDQIPAPARGAIVLMRRGDVTFNEKVANAVAAGAVAVIVYNNGPGNIVAQVDEVQLPAVTVAQAAGEQLASQATAGSVQATVTVNEPRGTGYNVIASRPGVTTCATVTGGHYDSVAVTGGADDNASGAAAVLEVARVAAARRITGDNCFVLFSAEELGLFGSKAYVAGLSPQQLQSMRAMLNLDVVGVASHLELVGDAGLVEEARVAGTQAGVAASAGALPPGASSDHASFANAGVPVVMFTRADNLIHTPADAMDRITQQSLGDTAKIAVATLTALSG